MRMTRFNAVLPLACPLSNRFRAYVWGSSNVLYIKPTLGIADAAPPRPHPMLVVGAKTTMFGKCEAQRPHSAHRAPPSHRSTHNIRFRRVCPSNQNSCEIGIITANSHLWRESGAYEALSGAPAMARLPLANLLGPLLLSPGEKKERAEQNHSMIRLYVASTTMQARKTTA